LSSPLKEKATIKKKHFLFPLKEDLYYYGGTYDRDRTDEQIDESAIEQLKNGLSEFYPETFEIVEVKYGFRPTVKDRRPIIGSHEKFKNLYVFNGLGARGVLNGCYFAKELYEHIENSKPLPENVKIDRF
ncbi:MAG: FAD-dependent oxidoreductase, partial [Bergeyella sp.]